MQAGILFAPGGPYLLAVLGLVYVFVTCRWPLWGLRLFLAGVAFGSFATFRMELQAVGTAFGILTLAAAGALRSPPRSLWPGNPIDRGMLVAACCVVLAGAIGLAAEHDRFHVAADLYHLLLVGPVAYAGVRFLVRPEDVEAAEDALITVGALWAVVAVLLLHASGPNGRLFWFVGAPLDEGGGRLEVDFGFPLVPLVLVSERVLRRTRRRDGLALAALAVALLFTYKRTLWVAYAAALAALVVPALRARVFRLRAVPVLVAGWALALVAAVVLDLNVTSALRRGQDIARPASVATLEARAVEWRGVLPIVLRHPLGLGLGASVVLGSSPGQSASRHHIHNMYLQWLVQAGVQLCAVMLALLVLVWRRLGFGPHAPHRGLSAAVLALAITGLAVLSFYSPVATVLLALGATARANERGRASSSA